MENQVSFRKVNNFAPTLFISPSMPNAKVLGLSAIIIVSIALNIFLYQNSSSLTQRVNQLEEDNNNLQMQVAAAQGAHLPTVGVNASSLSQLHANPSFNNFTGNESSAEQQSITAVAVRTIPVTDGFFQSVQYEGAVMDIVVDIRGGGKGRILVNTDVPTGVDFQSSAKTAVKVAQTITNTDLSTKDVIFSISSRGNATDLQAVDGGSAGGAMTVLLVSELQNKSIQRNVLMTGTINPDGTIGQIGGVEQKADAAGQYGAKVFLVPKGQSVYPAESCQQSQQGPIIYRTCQSEMKPLSDLTEPKYGMRVQEVSTVQEALSYFEAK